MFCDIPLPRRLTRRCSLVSSRQFLTAHAFIFLPKESFQTFEFIANIEVLRDFIFLKNLEFWLLLKNQILATLQTRSCWSQVAAAPFKPMLSFATGPATPCCMLPVWPL